MPDPSSLLATERGSMFIQIAELDRQMKRWKSDPIAYARERLHVVVWKEFGEILESVRDNEETAVQSCNAAGKTFCAAIILIWFLETHQPCKILSTGSSWRALKEHMWPYIHTLTKKNGLFPGNKPNDLSITLSDECQAFAASTNEAEGLMGAHSPNMLQIVEESSGIDKEIADAIQGNAKGSGSRIVWLGNPLRPSGPFYEKCKSGRVKTITISAFQHPNVIEGAEIIPGAVTRANIETDCEDWCVPCAPKTPGSIHLPWRGVDGWYIPSPVFIARVMGEFPEIDVDSLIDRVKLKAMCGRVVENRIPTVMSIDVARSTTGDETVIGIGNSDGVISLTAMRVNDLVLIVGKAIEILKANPSILRIAVDAIGIGAGIVDMLRANGYEVLAVNVAEPAMVKDDYFLNLKAQIYWEFKDRVEAGTFALPDDKLMREQIESLKPDFGMSGHRVKVKIEDKEKYKKRTGYSPDRAEACILLLHCCKYAVTMFVPDVYFENSNPYGNNENEYSERSSGGMFR